MWTTIKKVNFVWWLLCIILSLFAVCNTIFWWIGWQAIADYRVDTLWTNDKSNTQEHKTITTEISDIKTDIAVIKTDTTWIKEYLKNK